MNRRSTQTRNSTASPNFRISGQKWKLFSGQRFQHLVHRLHVVEADTFTNSESISLHVFSFCQQRISSLSPPAAQPVTFSLIPPTGNTRPRSDLPVIARKGSYFLPVTGRSDGRHHGDTPRWAVLGTAPREHMHVITFFSKMAGSIPYRVALAWR